MFIIFVLIPDKSVKSVTHALTHSWIQWAGPPQKIVYDQGGEFSGPQWQTFCDANRAFPMPRPTETVWQNGMVERHGGVMQEITDCILREEVCHAEDMFHVVVRASNAKNARVGRSGYSPRALVLGSDARICASCLNHFLEEADDAAIDFVHTDPFYAKSYNISQATMKAVVDLIMESIRSEHTNTHPAPPVTFIFRVTLSSFGESEVLERSKKGDQFVSMPAGGDQPMC